MMAEDHSPAAGWPALTGLSTGTVAALIALLVGAACLLLAPYAPWLVKYPAAWAVPATACRPCSRASAGRASTRSTTPWSVPGPPAHASPCFRPGTTSIRRPISAC